jgi:hypothetical protein
VSSSWVAKMVADFDALVLRVRLCPHQCAAAGCCEFQGSDLKFQASALEKAGKDLAKL